MSSGDARKAAEAAQASLYDARFRLVTGAELATEPDPMEWLVEGVWPAGSYGVLGGKKKTLKTYNLLALALAVATGEPFLGHFEVPYQMPVVMYLAEGGHAPTLRRLHRIAEWMGIEVKDADLHLAFDVASADDPVFVDRLAENLEDTQAGLFILDPLYAFHPAHIEAQNLYARGRMLSEMAAVVPDDCAFIVADHFRKTGVNGNDLDLDQISQSGMAQWADSWMLQTHRDKPLVDAGLFQLGVEFGSRQWGGARYAVDWHIGRFDLKTGEHNGALSVEVSQMDWDELAARSEQAKGRALDKAMTELLALIDAEPGVHTKNNVHEPLGMSQAKAKGAVESLIASGHLTTAKIKAQEGTRNVTRDRLILAPTASRVHRVAGNSTELSTELDGEVV